LVPLVSPTVTNFPAQGQYSCALVIQPREHKNALAILAGIGLFVLIYWFNN